MEDEWVINGLLMEVKRGKRDIMEVAQRLMTVKSPDGTAGASLY
jgi:hypothetical protein